MVKEGVLAPPPDVFDGLASSDVAKRLDSNVPTLQNFSTVMLVTPLQTKRRPLYLKTQSAPRCKHFSSGL